MMTIKKKINSTNKNKYKIKLREFQCYRHNRVSIKNVRREDRRHRSYY